MAQLQPIAQNDEPAQSSPLPKRAAIVDKAASVAGRPFYFGPSRELFGFYYANAPGSVPRGAAIVLCSPIGWDFEATYRAYGRLAERLYLEGFTVLRFAYHGTGDSSGSDYDPDRLEAWRGSLRLAIEEVKARSGSERVSLFGVRMGGLLAAITAPDVGGVDSMVLWAPCVAGKAYVRELGMARAVNPAESVMKGEKVAGGEEAGGFMLSASTVASLKGVNLLKTPLGAKRYLVLGRDDLTGGDAPFVRHLTQAGASASYLEPAGYQAMMVDPLESVVPEGAFDSVIGFLSEVHPPQSSASTAPPEEAELAAASEVRLDSTTAPVREEAVRFGGESQLFGVVTLPPSGGEKKAPTGIIFLNTGANAHVGPHRMYVPLSRLLAARGFVSLRFDIESFGDSPPREGVPANDSYSTYATVNAQAAIDYLRSRGVDRVVLAGMCSGAYHSFHTALADTRVAGAIMLRPQVFSWAEGEALDKQRRKNAREWTHYSTRLTQPEAWAKALRGKIEYRRALGTALRRAKAVATSEAEKLIARLQGQPKETKLVERFKAILRRDCETLLVYSKYDPGLDHLHVQTGTHLERLQKRKNFQLVLMDGADYSFAAVWSQDRLMEVIMKFLGERFG